MDGFCDEQQPQLPIDRIIDIDLDLFDLVECCLCHGILWYPVACENCEKACCLTCTRALHSKKSEPICPHDCSSYSERKCPPAITHILTNLKVICRYRSNGCTKTISYDELEKHEETCDYQLLSCVGCRQGIIKRDFVEHNVHCQHLSMTCDQCLTSYKRQDAPLHTLTECLRIQLCQQKSKIEQLEMKESVQQQKLNRMEQQLNEFNNFWTAFFDTTIHIRSMLDEQNESIKSSDHNQELPA